MGAGEATFKGLTRGQRLKQKSGTAGPQTAQTTGGLLTEKSLFSPLSHGAHPYTGLALETEEKKTLLQSESLPPHSNPLMLHAQKVV